MEPDIQSGALMNGTARMNNKAAKILIGFEGFADFLGISTRKVFRHRHAMKAAGVIGRHAHGGRFYFVALPAKLSGYWRKREWE
jgi:hypothetical protein